jgi:prepilin-type N-terminal cleavage/methylation domain-containing protein
VGIKAQKQKGFTLIELLLVVAILSVSVGVTTDVVLNITRSYNKTQVTNEIEQNANFVLLKLEKELRNARQVNFPVNNGDSSDVLQLTNTEGQTVCYKVENNRVQRRVGTHTNCSGTAGYFDLTTNALPLGVTVTSGDSETHAFTLISSNPYVIKLNLKFQQVGSAGGKSFEGDVQLDDTIVVRGSY